MKQRKKIDKEPEEKTTEEPAKPQQTALDQVQAKYRQFFTRSIWGFFMILFFGLLLYSDHTLICIFVVILQVMVFKEMTALRYQETKEREMPLFRTLNWFFLFIVFFYVYGGTILQQLARLLPITTLDTLHLYHMGISFGLYAVGFLLFIVTLRPRKVQKDEKTGKPIPDPTLKYQFKQLTWTLLTLLMCVAQSHFAIDNILKGIFWFLLPCSLIICNDIMAYFAGFFFGKKFVSAQLTSLSPNKTWEGFIGALVSTVIFAYFASAFLAQFSWMTCPKVFDESHLFGSIPQCSPDPVFVPHTYKIPEYLFNILHVAGIHIKEITILPVQLHSVSLALFASLIAPFGGFFASGIKRAYGVKDFDSLFPGHGGVTDRMDCQFIMALFTHVYYTVFIRSIYAPTTVEQILLGISNLNSEQLAAVKEFINSL